MTIRVAHVVGPSFISMYGGTTHRILSLLSGWNEKGITLDLYGSKSKPLNMNIGEKKYRLPEGLLWSSKIEQLSRSKIVLWNISILWDLFIHRDDYDIIHFHVLGWGSLISPLLFHSFGKKVVFTMSLYGNDNPSYILNQRLGQLQVSLLRKFDGSIGISPALVQDAIKHSIKNVICLPNFMAYPSLEGQVKAEEGRVLRRKLSIPTEATVLLYIGVAHRRKGLDVLIDAFIKLAKRYPDLWLIVVGPRNRNENVFLDDQFIPQIIEKIEQEQLQNRVIWSGIIANQDEICKYYWASDIFVLPTRNEGLGNVIIEAMYAELPVIVSDLHGITDYIIEDNETGFLVELDSVKEFSDQIEILLNNPKLRRKFGLAGRKRAIQLFDFQKYCHKLRDFYMGLE